jgi:hypothetical protein
VGSQGRLRGLGPAAGRSAPPAAAIRGAAASRLIIYEILNEF